MAWGRRIAVGLGAALVALAACPPPRPATHVEVVKGPPLPDFVAPPPLGPEPRPTADLPGREWLDAVHAALHARWADSFLEDCRTRLPPEHPLNNRGLAVVVSFEVNGAGGLGNAAVAAPSGDPEFDGAALEIVRELGALPPPPPAVQSDDGVARLTWRFARDERQDGIAGVVVERRELPPAEAVPRLLASGRVVNAALRIASAADDEPAPTGAAAAALVADARRVAGAVLEAALGDEEDADGRIAAARALGAVGWSAAIPTLRFLAREAVNLRLQEAAAEALAALGDAEAVPLLLEGLGRLDGERSVIAARALAELGARDQGWAALAELGARELARVAVLDTLAALAAPASLDRVLPLLTGKTPVGRAERAAAALVVGALLDKSGTGSGARALSLALGETDATVRAGAARALALAGARGVRSRGLAYKVLELVRDRDPRVRAGLVAAAITLSPAIGLPEATLVIRREKDPDVLVAAAGALGVAGGPEAVAELRRLLAGNPDVRLAAAAGLAAVGSPEATAALAPLAADLDPRVRVHAVAALGNPVALEDALRDAAPEVRAAAAAGLLRHSHVGGLAPALRALAAAASTRERALLAAAVLLETAR